MKPKIKKSFSFENAIESLETLVKSLESGTLSLEESLATFEKGIALSRECQATLAEAKLKVETLLQKTDSSSDPT